jgi:tetratricopeptide (TPR) repeat protein
MAGDWITEGLQKTGILEVVPTPTAFQASKYLVGDGASQTAGEPMRALAAETDARTVVGGAYYRRGDNLLFRVTVADRNGGRLIVTLADVEAPISDPLVGVQELRNRLMGWLAVQYDESVRDQIRSDDRPPTYQAYRAFSDAMNHYIAVENAAALPDFLAAFKMDSSFTVSLLYASITLTNLGQWARADSLLDRVDQRRAQLTPYDRAWLDYRLAFVRGNHEQALAAIREAARVAPPSKAAYNHAVEAFLSGHVHEALTTLEALPSDRGPMRGFSPYWDIYGAVLHSLGLYDREYDVSVAAQKAFPTRLTRYTPLLRAQIARGDIKGVAGTLEEAKRLPTDPLGWDYGHTLAEVAEELRAHAHPAEAAIYLEQLRRWLVEKDRAPASRWRLVRTLYWQGQYSDARRELTPLRLSDPGNPEYLGMSGLLSSRMGQSEAALAAMDTLQKRHLPYEFGLPSVYRARIAASLGDREAAVGSLAAAFEEGRSYELSLHRDIDFESLRGYPPFVALIRGKD